MKNLKAMVLAGVLTLGIGMVGTYLVNYNTPIKETKKEHTLEEKTKLFESRVEEFWENNKQKKPEEIYNMLLPSMQRDNPKGEYIQNLKSFFDNADITYTKSTVIQVKEKYGIAMTTLTVNLKKEGILNNCIKIFLVWVNDNYYFFRGAVCDYDFKDEIERVNIAKENY